MYIILRILRVEIRVVPKSYIRFQNSKFGRYYSKTKDFFKNTSMTEEKNRIESSLGFVKTETKFNEAICFIMSDSVRNQDKDSALISMAHAGKLQRDFVLKYTFEHMEEFRKIFDGVAIGRYLKNLLSVFSTREKLNEISLFFKQNPIRNASRSIDQGW